MIRGLCALLLLLSSPFLYGQKITDRSTYVNPFIGTAYHGHTFPGACAPFGMIQAGPETGNASWRYCSGYNYEDDYVTGFSQTRLNGTGVPELGDILLLPFSEEIKDGLYRGKMDKVTEKASPGYYAVSLPGLGVGVEITATERVAYHKYTFKIGGTARLLVDLQSGLVHSPDAMRRNVLHSETNMPDHKTITGHNEVNEWVRRHFFYVISFDRPYVVEKILAVQPEEKAQKMVLKFDGIKPGESVQVKIAISTVDIEGAKESLKKEAPGWNFDQVRFAARNKWNKIFAKADVDGSNDQKTNFYTAMYHLFMQPSNIADTDGRYRGPDDKIHKADNGAYYSTLSLWDTYRAAHPLYTLLMPEKVNDFVQTMIRHHKVAGFLPVWTLWGKDNYCMIGNHAIPVIADAYLKGFKGFDAEKAYEAIKQTATVSHFNSDWETYDRFGYYPFDIVERESVSRTLESAYDDYCIAQMARKMGKKEDEIFFTRRGNYYKNLLDPETKLMRGRDSRGNWRTPFDKFALSHFIAFGGDYTEGNAWQYTWHVQQDIPGLIKLMGGKKDFAAKLDTLFSLTSPAEPNVPDVTGLIGQYAHGNEPSHHVSYLYNYVDKSYRTQELIREITDRFYLPKPDGLCGNDDCGQMSAWYIFSAMGFYPVDPVSGEYILGAPQIKSITLHLPDKKQFKIKASNLSKENKYVKSVAVNNKPITGFSITHNKVMQGGVLEFVMKSNP
ncbi:MAG TPA: GH92 family glycosyl hydrolase [Niabella sp.]|nr:GH92 family glycosyl hydrolase [Niabella sp.]